MAHAMKTRAQIRREQDRAFEIREANRARILEERKDVTKYFEDTHIGYMLNQAQMNFFRIGSYPHYKVCENTGKLEIDYSDETQALKARARETQKVIKDIADRQKRGMRIPKTWMKKVSDERFLIMALDELQVSVKDWSDEFYRMLRWFETI